MKKSAKALVLTCIVASAFVGRLLAAELTFRSAVTGDQGRTNGAGPAASALVSRIDSVVDDAMQAQHMVGASVGVMLHEKLIVAKGYGFAELENDVPATEHTVYRIGSATKQFTAAAVMLLVERGQIRLDDDLTKYLPAYATRGHRITIDRLLTHTSGIKGYTEMPAFWEKARLDVSQEEMMALFGGEPFEFTPGERYQYNNSAYFLLGVIIEKVTGSPYAEFVQKNVFAPAGLKETYYLDEEPIVKRRAQGYEFRNGTVVNDEFLSMKLPYSGGSLGSTVLDLMTWRRALTGGSVVRATSYERMTTPATLNDGSKTTYGYGLAIGEMEGHPKISHGGGINGFRTQLDYYPKDDLTVVVLCNSGSAKPDILGSRIARLVLGIQEKAVTAAPMSEDDLKQYAGVYDPGRSPIRVSLEKGSLVLAEAALMPLGAHRFVVADDPYQQVSFTLDASRVVSVKWEREGQKTIAQRVSP